MPHLENLSTHELLKLCRSINTKGQLDPWEQQTLSAIQDSYFSSGEISSAEKKFLEDLIVKYSNN